MPPMLVGVSAGAAAKPASAGAYDELDIRQTETQKGKSSGAMENRNHTFTGVSATGSTTAGSTAGGMATTGSSTSAAGAALDT